MKYIAIIIALLACVSIPIQSKETVVGTKISGIVYDYNTKEPISGAIITIPNVISKITNEKGEFELDKTVKGAYIIVEAPGFSIRKIYLRNKNKLSVFLYDGTNIGFHKSVITPYQEEIKGQFAGSLSSFESTNQYQSGITNVDQLLQGRLNGLHILQRSGMPGAGANMFLNGFNSMNATTQPLVVVDGVIYDNSPFYSLVNGNNASALADLDIRDIDKVTVLKDGGSIYGSKAANGVLLINTIRSKGDATRISFHTHMGLNVEPSAKYNLLNGKQYKTYLSEYLLNDGMSINQINALPYFNNEKPVIETWGVSGNPDYYRYNHENNWQNEVFRSSMNQSYYLSVTGGNEKSLIAVSVGYLGQSGDLKNTSYQRYSTRLNTDIHMTDWLTLNANISFIYTEKELAFENSDRNFSPLYTSLIKAPFMSSYVYNTEGNKTANLENVDALGVSNPAVLILNPSLSDRFRFFGNVGGDIRFSKSLSANVSFGLTSDVVTKEKVFLPNAGVNHDISANGLIFNESQQLRNILKVTNVESRLNYKKSFDFTHNLHSFLGFRFQSAISELDWGKAFNTSNDQMQTLGDGMNTMAKIGGSLGNWNSVSTFLNVDYDYLNKYFLMFNSALDGSSRFGKNANGVKMFSHVFGFFPSVNAAWVVTSEDFMNNIKAVDFLRLRAGHSVTGNDDIGNYSSHLYYVPQVLLGAYGLVNGNIPNSALKWETVYKTTVGFDISLFNERININLDLYKSVTKDLIKLIEVPSVFGVNASLDNDGSMQNVGIDLSISSRLISNKDFKFDATLNLSAYKNKMLTSSDNENFTNAYNGIIRTKVGSPISQFYGYKTQGVISTSNEASDINLNTLNNEGSLSQFAPGDIKFFDRDMNHIIDEKDMMVIGDPNPDFFGSLLLDFSWRRFKLSSLFTYSYGNDIYNSVRANLESMSNKDNQSIRVVHRWKTDGQITNIPKIAPGDPMGNSRFSDRWIEDGSFIKLKTITFSYDFNIKSKVINHAEIYVAANNLFIFTKYLGFDPEFSISTNPLYFGIDNGMTPQQKTILTGVKINL